MILTIEPLIDDGDQCHFQPSHLSEGKSMTGSTYKCTLPGRNPLLSQETLAPL